MFCFWNISTVTFGDKTNVFCSKSATVKTQCCLSTQNTFWGNSILEKLKWQNFKRFFLHPTMHIWKEDTPKWPGNNLSKVCFVVNSKERPLIFDQWEACLSSYQAVIFQIIIPGHLNFKNLIKLKKLSHCNTKLNFQLCFGPSWMFLLN